MIRRSSRWMVAALGAGLMTGLSRFPDTRLAIGGLVIAAAILWRRPAGLLVVAGLVGTLVAAAARWTDAGSCAARLPAAELEMVVRLAEVPLARAARALPVAAGCHGTIRIRLPTDDQYTAGTRLRLSGRWIPRPAALRPATGLLVVREAESLGGDPRRVERFSMMLTRRSAELFGARAGVVDALILGRREGMDVSLREAFSQAGLVHLLAISGFHVGLLVSWVVLLGQAAGLRRDRAWLLGASVAVAYVAMLGWPAPATRAAWLAVLAAVGLARQRAVSRPALIATACLGVVILDPWAVFDLGAWLSVTSIVGLSAATRWSDHAIGTGWGWTMLSASIGSTLATAPITAAVLGAVAPVGILLNFVAIPLAAVAVPGVLFSLLIGTSVPALGPTLAAGTGLALAGMESLARLGARIPGGHVVAEPGLAAAMPWVILLVVAGWGIRGGTTAFIALHRWGWAALVIVWAATIRDAWPVGGDGDATLTLHFLDVGQGDAAAIRTPRGQWVLVDAGPADARIDAGRRVVAPFLLRQGARRLDAVVVSHGHVDHLGGVPAVLSRIPAQVVLEPAMASSDPGYQSFLEWVATTGQPWRAVRGGESFVLDGVRFAILHPDTTWGEWGLDLNENSVVVQVSWGAFAALFTGDVGFPAEMRLASRVGPVDLLKVGHHGSRGSSGEAFLAALSPRVGIISAGRNNRHGHPAPAALDRLAGAGVTLFRTDRDGSIRVSVDSTTMTIHGAGRAQTIPLRPRGPP